MSTPNSCWPPSKRPWTMPRPQSLIPNLWKRLTPPLQRRNPQPKNPNPLTEKVSLVLKKSYWKSFAYEKELKLLLGMFLLFVILFSWGSVLLELHFSGVLISSKTIEWYRADQNKLQLKRLMTKKHASWLFKSMLGRVSRKSEWWAQWHKILQTTFPPVNTKQLKLLKVFVELRNNVEKCAEILWLFLRFAVLSDFYQYIIYLETWERK